jgi:hypothetical protein
MRAVLETATSTNFKNVFLLNFSKILLDKKLVTYNKATTGKTILSNKLNHLLIILDGGCGIAATRANKIGSRSKKLFTRSIIL